MNPSFKPNCDNHCSTEDFSDYLDNPDNCYCIDCGKNTVLKYFSTSMDVFKGNDLYDLAVSRLKESYTPDNLEDDTIYELIHEEYLRVRQEVCLEYAFDENGFMDENGGETPFDEFDNAIREEVYIRIEGIESRE